MTDEARDYSGVSFPWEGDPHWGAPREGATSDPGDGANWRMACVECGLHFPDDVTMGTVGAHWVTQHHPEESLAPQPSLNLVWVGLGTPPPGGRS